MKATRRLKCDSSVKIHNLTVDPNARDWALLEGVLKNTKQFLVKTEYFLKKLCLCFLSLIFTFLPNLFIARIYYFYSNKCYFGTRTTNFFILVQVRKEICFAISLRKFRTKNLTQINRNFSKRNK